MSRTQRTSPLEGESPETPRRPKRSENGDTLIEVLLALVVLGLASVALIIAFSTSLSASALHRRLASADIVLNSTSQQAIAGIGSQLTLFTSCVTTTTSPTTITTFLASAGISIAPTYSSQFTATITNVQYWNAATSTFDSTCRTDVPEEITVTVTDSTGHQYTNTFVVDYPLASATSSTNVGPGSQLVWATPPSSSGSSGSPLSTQPVLEIENSLGQPVTSDYSPVIISIASGANGVLSSCSGNENSGFVAFTGCTLSLTGGATSGTFTLKAVDGSLTSTLPNPTVSLSGATQPYLVFTTEPTAGNSGAAFSPQPVVTVEQNGSPITWTGSITLASSGGVLSGCSGLSTTTGVFNISGCTFEGGFIYDPVSNTYAAIPYTLYASGTGLTSATSSAFTVNAAGAPSKLVFSTQPSGVSSGTASTAFSTQPVVTVEDAFGNVVTSYNTSVSMAISAGQTLHGCTAVTPTKGVATFSNCAGSTFATGVTLTASSVGLPSQQSAAFDITGLASKLVFTTQPVAGVSGVTFGFEPVITIYDSNGFVVTASTTPIALTVTPPTNGGILSLCTGLTPVNGIVTVSTCTFGGIVGANYTLTATQGALSVVSATFSPTGPGSASQLAFTTEPVAGASQSPFTTQPVVKVEDSAGNIVITDNETITLSASGGVLSGCSNLSAVTGVINVANCVFEGIVLTNYTMTASTAAGDLTPGTSTTFTPSGPGPASQVVLSGCSATITWPNSCVASAVAEDVDGNHETSYSSAIIFSQLSSTGGTVSGLGSVTAVAGAASDTLTATNVGTLTIGASGDGFSSAPVTITIVGALQTVAFYTSGTYGTTTTSGTTTYNPSTTYPLFAQGSQNGVITFNSTTTSVCTVNTATGSVTTVSVGTCNLTAAAAAIGNYAASSTTPFTLTITPAAALTVTAQSHTLTYTGIASVADSSNVSGLLGSDAATVTSATYTYAGISGTTYGPSVTRPSNPGTYSVTPSAATLNFTAGAASDYTSPNTYVAGTLIINTAPALTVTARNQTLTYTGSPAVVDTSSVTGFVGSDAATVTSATYTYTGISGTTYGPSATRPTNPGAYSVTPSAATLNFTTGAATDYTSPNTYVAGTLTINAAPSLTVTAGTQSLTFTASAAVADTSSVTGFAGSDAATVTSATYSYTGTGGTTYGPSATPPTNVGTYSVTPSAAVLNFTSGAAADYTPPNTYVAGTLTITKATLTVTAANQNLTYTASPAVVDTSAVSGLLGTDAATVTSATYSYTGISGTIYGPSATRPTSAGTYSVTPSAATLNFTSGLAANYSGSYTYVVGTLTIAKANQLALTVTSTTATYGTALTLTSGGGSGLGAVSYTVANGTATGCAVPGGVLSSTSVGTCMVTATKASDTNYLAASSAATAVTVNTAPALTVTAGTQSLTYTGSAATADTSTVSGFKYSDAATVTSATYSYAGTGATTYGPSATPPTLLGTYSVTPSAATLNFTAGAAADYNSPNTYVAGTLTITKATLTVTAANQNLTYTSIAAVADTSSVSGLQGSDAATVTSATYSYHGISGTTYGPSATPPTIVGTYSVTPSAATLNFTSGSNLNYISPYTYAAGTLTIAKANQLALTVTSSTTATYGTALTLTSGGGSGTGAVSYSASNGTATGCAAPGGALSSTSVGTCFVTATKATDTNYLTASSAATSVTIIPATALVVTAASQTLTYTGSAAVADTSGVTGFVNSDAATVTAATYSYAGTGTTTYGPSATPPTLVGTYSVTPSAATFTFTTGAAADYNTPNTYVVGTLTITIAASDIANGTAAGTTSVTSGTTFSAPSGSPVLVLVSYDDKNGANAANVCDATLTGTALSAGSLLGVTNYAPYQTTGSGANKTYYQMCVYETTGTGITGSVTVGFGGLTVANSSFQVVQFQGDITAGFTHADFKTVNNSNVPTFILSASPGAGSSEVLFGVTTATSNTWSTAPVGFTNLFAPTTVNGTFTPAAYFGAPAAISTSGLLTANTRWATIGIEVTP